MTEAMQGAFDGANTGLGLVMGLVAGAAVTGMVKVAIPAIAAGASSMAASELVKDNDNGWEEVTAMGTAWTVMAVLPVVLAVVLGGWLLWGAVGLWLAGLAAVMARTNGGGRGAWLRAYGCSLVVAAVTAGAALVG